MAGVTGQRQISRQASKRRKRRDWRSGPRQVISEKAKVAFVEWAGSVPRGEIGQICKDFGITSSQLAAWRVQISRGELSRSSSPKRGRKGGEEVAKGKLAGPVASSE